VSTLKALVTLTNVDPCVPRADGFSPHLTACVAGHVDIVRYYVERIGIDPRMPNVTGWTPIVIAATHGNLEIVRYLISVGVDPTVPAAKLNAQTQTQSMPSSSGDKPKFAGGWLALALPIAAKNGHIGVVEELLRDKRCDINAPDMYRRVPLDRAVSSGQLEMVRYLVEECRAKVIRAVLDTAKKTDSFPESAQILAYLTVFAK
jgi:ankyrin repeat protein